MWLGSNIENTRPPKRGKQQRAYCRLKIQRSARTRNAQILESDPSLALFDTIFKTSCITT